MRPRRSLAVPVAVLAGYLALTGCSISSDGADSSSTSAASALVPEIDASAFTPDFSAMGQLKDIASQGDGKIQVLLPDTTFSTRYVQDDAPLLQKAFEAAGLREDQFAISNAHGSPVTMQQQATAAIKSGAVVLLVDPLDPASGAAIEQDAVAQGVAVIDYDRLVTGGPRDRYFVGFDDVAVGELIGRGLTDCVRRWHVKDPTVLVMNGSPSDDNAAMFNQGYMSVLNPLFGDGRYTMAGEPPGTWDPRSTASTFERQYTAHPRINAVVTAHDDSANAVIGVLRKEQVRARTFPTTGQDASLTGLRNILDGYQCGTVDKPIYLEAQAAAALALYLRAGLTPPSSLVNSSTRDPQTHAHIPSVYGAARWVTRANMADTVVKDGSVTVNDLCAGTVARHCRSAGIN